MAHKYFIFVVQAFFSQFGPLRIATSKETLTNTFRRVIYVHHSFIIYSCNKPYTKNIKYTYKIKTMRIF